MIKKGLEDNLSEDEDVTITIYSVLGIKLYRKSLHTNSSTLPAKIDISTFSNGIYFITIDNGKEKTVKKFIKN